MNRKNIRHTGKHSHAHIRLLLFFLLAAGLLLILGFILIVSNVAEQKENDKRVEKISSAYTLVTDWKTYTDNTNGFTYTYPARGADYFGNSIECGKAIRVSSDYVAFDNFFSLFSEKWDGTLAEYIQATNLNEEEYPNLELEDLYIFTPIKDTNADEAIRVSFAPGGYENGAGGDAAPFPATAALYLKNGTLITLSSGFQDHASLPGCYYEDTPSNWDPAKSIKFL